MVDEDRLTPDEDAQLRRLHWFEALGCHLSDAISGVKSTIRARDRRAGIREPLPEFGNNAEIEPRIEQEGGYWVRVRN